MKSTELVAWLCKNFPGLVQDMRATNHSTQVDISNPYHVEDDVWTHTMMVLLMTDRLNLSLTNKVTALLHDIGKILTREVADLETPRSSFGNDVYKKCSFKGHEGVSFYMAIDILEKMVQDSIIKKEDINKILKTISLHGTLFDYIKDSKEFKPEDFIGRFNNAEECIEVILQSKADSLGRFALDKDIAEELCETLYSKEVVYKHIKKVKKYDFRLPYLELLVGIPNSGKSTYVASKLDNFVVISRDDTLMEYSKEKLGLDCSYTEVWKHLTDEDQSEIDKILLRKFNLAVKTKNNIVIDMTNVSRKSRRKWTNIKGYNKIATVFKTSWEEAKRRNQLRNGKTLRENILLNMAKGFIVPGYDEVDFIKWVS